ACFDAPRSTMRPERRSTRGRDLSPETGESSDRATTSPIVEIPSSPSSMATDAPMDGPVPAKIASPAPNTLPALLTTVLDETGRA
ncbi:unnamed protein product, partial [Penicillium egyptiacum]